MAPKSHSATRARLPRRTKTTAIDAIRTFFDPKYTPAEPDYPAQWRRQKALIRKTPAQKAKSKADRYRITRMYPGDRKKQMEEVRKLGARERMAMTPKEIEEFRERQRRWNAGEEAELYEEFQREEREYERAQEKAKKALSKKN
jgi:hypothetical protein